MKDIMEIYILLNKILPNEKIEKDIIRYLGLKKDLDDFVEIELDEKTVSVPMNTDITIISKSVLDDFYSPDFGALKAQVSIGKAMMNSLEALESEYCFAVLIYGKDSRLITVDFSLYPV